MLLLTPRFEFFNVSASNIILVGWALICRYNRAYYNNDGSKHCVLYKLNKPHRNTRNICKNSNNGDNNG